MGGGTEGALLLVQGRSLLPPLNNRRCNSVANTNRMIHDYPRRMRSSMSSNNATWKTTIKKNAILLDNELMWNRSGREINNNSIETVSVKGFALGHCQMLDNALVLTSAARLDNATVLDNAPILDSAAMLDNATVLDNAPILDCAAMLDNAQVLETISVRDNVAVEVLDNAASGTALVQDTALFEPDVARSTYDIHHIARLLGRKIIPVRVSKKIASPEAEIMIK